MYNLISDMVRSIGLPKLKRAAGVVTRHLPIPQPVLMVGPGASTRLGLGEGGEQNAPLGRAVIGGLIFATIATLMFVPVVFSMVHKKQGAKAAALPETTHAH